ncbi:hypothetical protein JCM8547_005801 [Rhodosporidiobolus lusitaniae]
MATRTRMPRKATQTWGTNKTNKGKKALKRRKVEVEESEEDEEESEVEEEDSDDDEKDPDWGKPARKTKKRKTDGKGKVNGKKDKTPKVDYLETLPFDMLCEIFSYLHPGELLALSRTAKPYRQLLMSKQSKFIWRKSRLFVEMPNLASLDLSEPAHAALFFDKACEVCDKKNAGAPDIYLRNRLCKDCRMDHLVKLNKLFEKHPEYHPLVSKVIVSTPGLRNEHHTSSSSPVSTRSGRVSKPRLSYNEDSDDSDADEDEYKAKAGSRVTEFVQGMQKELEVLEQAAKSDKQRDKEQEGRSNYQAKWARKSALKDKIATLPGQAHWPSDLYGKVWEKSAFVNTSRVLDDDEWEEIKDDVFSLVNEVRADQQRENIGRQLKHKWNNAILEREKAIRKRYNRLRKHETDDFARAAYPLFVDFLRLESVKPLLLPEEMPSNFEAEQENGRAELSDDDWEEQEELVKEEVEQHRLDLVLHAVKLIIRATAEDELPSDEEIVDNLGDYDDDFFEMASSFLCCDSWKQATPFHFSVPLEVASATSALLELGGLDDSTATEANLDDLEQKTSSFDWLNGHGQRKHFEHWRPLLDSVYRESQRFAKMKPPRAMDPPCIARKIRRKKKSGPGLSMTNLKGFNEEDELESSDG